MRETQKHPGKQETEAKEDVQRGRKPSYARRGKELDRKKRHKREGAQEGKRGKLHVRERDSMCKKNARNDTKSVRN